MSGELDMASIYQRSMDSAFDAELAIRRKKKAEQNEPWDNEGKVSTAELKAEAQALFSEPQMLTISAQHREATQHYNVQPPEGYEGPVFSKRYVDHLVKLNKLRQEAE